MTTQPREKIQNEIREQIQKSPVLLFMKGDRVFPQCGFSAQVVEILDHLGLEYETQDVLSNPELRSELKVISNWPTFPQLYVQGELIGGCDIITSLFQSGELEKKLEAAKLLKKEQNA